MKYIVIDLYTGVSEMIEDEYAQDMIDGCELVEGDRKVYRCEEYIVVCL